MSRIKIKNFGPIQGGFKENRGWMEIKKVTAFIGDNGSGKSTVAKLISIFTWLEKALIRKDFSAGRVNNTILKTLCRQHDIEEYFKPNTQMAYSGDFYDFSYSGRTDLFYAKTKSTSRSRNFLLPKIQYVSSARNLLTILYQVPQASINFKGKTIDLMSHIPFMVRDLNNVYYLSLNTLANNGFKLPIKDIKVYHQNHSTYFTTEGKRISMAAASSGIQSITPLLIVSEYLADYVQKSLYEKYQDVNKELTNRIEKQCDELGIRGMLERYRIGGHDLMDTAEEIAQTENVLKQYLSSYFVNIVEEPEQNLFPTSQQHVLNRLLECNNAVKENKLIISTHSPYILTALNNAIFAEDVYAINEKTIDEIPKSYTVSFNNLSAYKLENGEIFSILNKETRLIDAAQIDDCSTKINEIFDKLMDLSDE